MSVWNSLGRDLPDNAWETDYQPVEPKNHYVDIATAKSWNECVRISIFPSRDLGGTEEASVMVSTDDALVIADLLVRAATEIKAGLTR